MNDEELSVAKLEEAREELGRYLKETLTGWANLNRCSLSEAEFLATVVTASAVFFMEILVLSFRGLSEADQEELIEVNLSTMKKHLSERKK